MKPDPHNATWIAVDWGTSNMRAWLMAEDGTELATLTSDLGMGDLTPEQFEPTLVELVTPWLRDRAMTVVACGMVGARQGWCEAPYATVPCAATAHNLVQAPCDHPLLTVYIAPGVKQNQPADVMRGEETQIAGFLALNPNWDGVICLPGTHTKWVQVSAGEIVSFQTFMSGELFAMLGEHSILRHSVAAEGWDNDAFEAGLDAAISKPELLAARLFGLRAENLLHDMSGATARSRLSGLLIGAELAAARPYWLGQNVAVIGASSLSKLYGDTLAAQGVPTTMARVDRMTCAGLASIYKTLKETS